jgi:acyl-CoA thioesterase
MADSRGTDSTGTDTTETAGDEAAGDEAVDPALFAALAADPLALHLGIELDEVRPGYARAAMTVGPQHLNAVGTAHGGATMALLDVVHAAVSNSHGTLAVAQDVHTEFLDAGRPGDRLTAEGVELHRTGRTAVYRIEVTTPEGRRVATALARVFRLDRPWLPATGS